MKKKNLTLISIKSDYIDFLYKHDKEVLFNKETKKGIRKYIGVIISVNEHKYFAPLSSQTEEEILKKDKLDSRLYFAIKNNIHEELGIIRFDKMIPVIDECINKYDFAKETDLKYKTLVLKQLRRINSTNSLKEINTKVSRIHKDYIHNRLARYSEFHPNFSKLEELSLIFKANLNKNT